MTEGQTPAGWYDDGRGQLRWYDGTAWTEHVHPLPTQAAPPVQEQAAQPAAAPVAAAPAAQVPPAAQAAPAAALGAPGSHQQGDPWVEPTPVYRKPWFLALAGLVVLAVIAGIFLLTSGSDDEEPNAVPQAPRTSAPATGGTTPTTGATTAPTGGTGASFVGADASAVAAAAGCTSVTPLAASTTPPTTGAAPKSKATCTLNGTLYTVVTWATAADQAAPGSLGNAFTQPVTAGTKYYATGDGWTAFDTTYDQTAAQAFATPAGGSVKGVVVVLSASPAPAA